MTRKCGQVVVTQVQLVQVVHTREQIFIKITDVGKLHGDFTDMSEASVKELTRIQTTQVILVQDDGRNVVTCSG